MSNPFSPRRRTSTSSAPTTNAPTPAPEPAPASATPPVPAPEAPGAGPTRAPLPERKHLTDMRKPDLQQLCRDRHITFAADDTRAELIEKLEATR